MTKPHCIAIALGWCRRSRRAEQRAMTREEYDAEQTRLYELDLLEGMGRAQDAW